MEQPSMDAHGIVLNAETAFSRVAEVLRTHDKVVVSRPGASLTAILKQFCDVQQFGRLTEVLVADERLVDDPQLNNARALRGVLPHQIRVVALSEESAQEFLGAPCILGVGEDGHIASLFPGLWPHLTSLTSATVLLQPEMEPMVERLTITPWFLRQSSLVVLVSVKGRVPLINL